MRLAAARSVPELQIDPNQALARCSMLKRIVKFYMGPGLRIASKLFVALWIGTCVAWGQQVTPPTDLYQGHILAAMYCASCHVAAPDQRYPPDPRQHTPSFKSIARRHDINAQSLRTFLDKTHRGLDNPKGMPSPNLADYQINQIIVYILSLRK
jgi:Cytochrome c